MGDLNRDPNLENYLHGEAIAAERDAAQSEARRLTEQMGSSKAGLGSVGDFILGIISIIRISRLVIAV